MTPKPNISVSVMIEQKVVAAEGAAAWQSDNKKKREKEHERR